MSLLDRLLGRDTDEEVPPPKPPDEQRQRDLEFDVYEVTVEYRNGETETFESFGRYHTDDHTIRYNVEPYPVAYNRYGEADARHGFARRTVNYAVLAREPIERHVRTETWRLSWTVTHTERPSWSDKPRWKPEATDLSIERVGRGDDAAGDLGGDELVLKVPRGSTVGMTPELYDQLQDVGRLELYGEARIPGRGVVTGSSDRSADSATNQDGDGS